MIDYEERLAVYKSAISQNGAQLQAVVALEELSEAQREICKYLRGNGDANHLAEEIADATIMLEQLQVIFNMRESVCNWMSRKVQRLENRLRKVVEE